MFTRSTKIWTTTAAAIALTAGFLFTLPRNTNNGAAAAGLARSSATKAVRERTAMPKKSRIAPADVTAPRDVRWTPPTGDSN